MVRWPIAFGPVEPNTSWWKPVKSKAIHLLARKQKRGRKRAEVPQSFGHLRQ
jgi:hypothetical protein